jgi:HK97 family phage major capsid protein
VRGKKWSPPSPSDASEAQWQSLYLAAKSRTPYSATVGEDIQTKAMGSVELTTKAATAEGAPGSLLPSVLLPQAFGLLYEPDRLFEHFPGLTAESQSVSYLQHTGNVNPAAPVAELATKPDLGMTVVPKTVSFTTIAALATFSRLLLDGFQGFYAFVPQDLRRAVIDAETDQICNADGTGANMTGILHTSGVQTRPVGTDTVFDARVKAFNDLRVVTSYATADLVALHPSTWTKMRTQKATTGAYLLAALNASDVADVNDVFGVPVVTNSKVPIRTGIVFDTTIAVRAWTRMALEMMTNPYGDTEFQTNAIQFRCEERITIGVIRPTAVCVVTGLGS